MDSLAAKAPGAGQLPTLPRVSQDLLDRARMAVVVDTNIFIDDLPLLRVLSRIAHSEQLVIVVPSAVVRELDGLKHSSKELNDFDHPSTSLSYLARAASKFLSDDLGREGSALRCQKIPEYLREESMNDDKIVDCCLYILEQRGLPVVLLTRDRILSIKARANGCATCDKWSNGPSGLLSDILATGGLQAQAPTDAVSTAMAPLSDAEYSSSPSSHISYEPPKRPLRVGKRAERVSVKDAHRLKDSSPQRKGVVSKGGPTLKGAERPPKRGEKRNGAQSPSTLKDKVTTLDAPARAPLPVAPKPSPTEPFSLGRPSVFTFTMPADPSSSAALPGLKAGPKRGNAVESNDMDVDSDVDMSGNSDDRLANVHPVAQHTQLPKSAAQLAQPSHALRMSPANSRSPDPITPTDDQQQRTVIYLDESPERNRLLGQAHYTSMSATGVSENIVRFMHAPLICGLTDLLKEQLTKYLPSGWLENPRMTFAMSNWGSATVMLTLVLYHWHDVFSRAFNRNLPTLIRESLPWVMRVEGLTECPQTTKPLPSPFCFKPFAYSSGSSAAGPANGALDEEGQQEAERRAEARKLINLAKSMLAQCHLIESDTLQNYRKKIVEGWVAWCDTHS